MEFFTSLELEFILHSARKNQSISDLAAAQLLD